MENVRNNVEAQLNVFPHYYLYKTFGVTAKYNQYNLKG